MQQDDAGPAPMRGSVAHHSAFPNSWIPVTERLPKEYETVLVATDGAVSAGEIRFPFDEGPEEPWWMVFKDRRYKHPFSLWAGMVSLNDVTHWMPLPAPPTDERTAVEKGIQRGSDARRKDGRE